MPDVPERCPECGSGLSQQFERGYHLAWYKCNSILFCNGRFQQSLACLQNQRDDLRAEAERWRKRYETLRAGVEQVVQDLHERAHTIALVARSTRDWELYGASDAYYEIERVVRMVRRVLGEAGGGEGAQ